MLNGLEDCPKLVCVGGGDAGPGRMPAADPKLVCVGGGEVGPGVRPYVLGL